MTDAPHALLAEALKFLEAHGIDVSLDKIDGSWNFAIDGVALTSSDVIARAVALGMLASSGSLQ